MNGEIAPPYVGFAVRLTSIEADDKRQKINFATDYESLLAETYYMAPCQNCVELLRLFTQDYEDAKLGR